MLFKSTQTVYRVYAVMGMTSGLAFVMTTFLAGRHATQIYPVLGMVVGFAFAIMATLSRQALMAEATSPTFAPVVNVGITQRMVASLFRFSIKLVVVLTLVMSLYGFATWI